MSPTTILFSGTRGAAVASAAVRHGAGVPGVGRWVGREGCYTGTPPVRSQDWLYTVFKVKGPTYGQMKAILDIMMRFLR